MSYILDALKRADSERERGAVPGLHTRHALPPVNQAGHGRRPLIWLGAGAAALALGGLGAGLWLWQTPAGTVRLAAVEPAVPSPAEPAAPLAQTQTVRAPAPPPVTAPSPPLSLAPPAVVGPRAAASLPSAVSKPAPTPMSSASPADRPGQSSPGLAGKAATPEAVAAITPKPLPGAKASSTAPAPAPAPTAQAAPVVSAVQAASATLPLLGELPEAVRRQVPPLAITGSVYSENRAQRMLLVNNQVLSESSLAAPDVYLEEIRAKSSVFSFRGTRFRITH